jgi:pimeloyl-ACP methyl ester carboxylesterase
MTTRFDAPVGRYIHVELEGVDHRIYFEEAGEGIPVLLQHTAGTNGVQWRHVLEDEWIRSRFRLIAYDLPFHGKSLPPTEREWWREPYKLTTDGLMAIPVGISQELGLERPVFMGCSIGGMLALALARWHPEAFRAVIAVEPALKIELAPSTMRGMWHPRVSDDFKGAIMYGLTGPMSPEKFRREVAFSYAQAWPAAHVGDVNFYAYDCDLREEARHIDTQKVAVHLLSGEYDYSATVAHGEAAHAAITGSTFQVMEGVGHFPMVENPERFISYIRPVLESIVSSGDTVPPLASNL